MKIDSIENGLVLDHIQAGQGMNVYNALNLQKLDCSVAVITKVRSGKMGMKDLIKINEKIHVDLDVLGYLDPCITITVIQEGEVTHKLELELPERITNVIKCKNPRCITSIEQELDNVFTLADKENKVYRCLYCETKASR